MGFLIEIISMNLSKKSMPMILIKPLKELKNYFILI